MEQIDFDDINEKIDQENSGKGNSRLTPQISDIVSFTNYGLEYAKVRLFLEENQFNETKKVPEKLYDAIFDFLMDEENSYEEKENISKYMDDKAKQYVFKAFFERIKKDDKNFYVDMDIFEDDDWENVIHPICYNPRINGVPLKDYKNKKISIYADKLYDILNQKNIPDSPHNIVILNAFLDSYDYFNMPWCIDNVKILKEQLKEEKVGEILELIDKQKIEFIKNSEKVSHNTKINEELKQSIISDMPKDFNQMEQAIYLYIRLCQKFTYDDVYFYNEEIMKHTDVSNVANYGIKNNKLVCYVFSYIYSELLRSIGVNYIKESKIENGKFENQHANLEFLIEDIVIFADSTTTIEAGDLINAKSYSMLVGIRCMLLDREKQKIFKESLKRVYNYIKEKDNAMNMIPKKEDVEGLYIAQKFQLFNKCLENSNFYDIDLLSYLKQLKNAIFTKNEQEENIRIKMIENLKYRILMKQGFDILEYSINLRTRQLFSKNIQQGTNKKTHERKTKSIQELVQEAIRIKDFTLLDEISKTQASQEREHKEQEDNKSQL